MASPAQDDGVRAQWLAPQVGWLPQIHAILQARQLHPTRVVVLVPYAQLMAQAAALWACSQGDGFAPRFETTRNWSHSLAPFVPGPQDLSLEVALDWLKAQHHLHAAGLGAQAQDLASDLVSCAHQLGERAAALLPAQRIAWASELRPVLAAGMQADVLQLESALVQVALAWAAHSAYATDVLLQGPVDGVDAVLVLPGFQAESLLPALQQVWGERLHLLHTPHGQRADWPQRVALHETLDAQEEAQRAAACVVQHLQQGRAPVALIATDRVLTRRVRSLLAASGVRVKDENGWKLSTSRAGAHVMGALRACIWRASSDQVLDWLKNAPALPTAAVQALEAHLRRHPVRDWGAGPALPTTANPALGPLLQQVQDWRASLQASRSLADWLQALRTLLIQTGQWERLQNDVAGEALRATLRLDAEATLDAALQSTRRLRLQDFIDWVDQALEGASFRPESEPQAPVVILPLAQLLGRSFAAVVAPACDEVRLSLSPELPGPWTSAQRLALGLPSREQTQAALQAAWDNALLAPRVDVLWRSSEAGEPLSPSPVVQALRLQHPLALAPDVRSQREVCLQVQTRPAPVAPELLPRKLSASAYAALRQCPYRFFALQQLGLKEVEELEGELDKRDYGQWLHAVLQTFHETLQADPTADLPTRQRRLDAAAQQVTQTMALPQEEFLPFMASWPSVREGYLTWLSGHEAQGHVFEAGELALEVPVAMVRLQGRIDRVDRPSAASAAGPGPRFLLDYKTESLAKTRQRVKEPLEDTQLAFYAALLPDDTVRAAYLNVSEREGCELVEQDKIESARDALIEGLAHDMQRIAEGAALPALGEGEACDYCAARGLCRKDFWTPA